MAIVRNRPALIGLGNARLVDAAIGGGTVDLALLEDWIAAGGRFCRRGVGRLVVLSRSLPLATRELSWSLTTLSMTFVADSKMARSVGLVRAFETAAAEAVMASIAVLAWLAVMGVLRSM